MQLPFTIRGRRMALRWEPPTVEALYENPNGDLSLEPWYEGDEATATAVFWHGARFAARAFARFTADPWQWAARVGPVYLVVWIPPQPPTVSVGEGA